MSTENSISFDENKYKIKSRSILVQAEVPKMITFLTTKGIVKNEKQAQMVLLGATACFFIASIFVFMVFVLDVEVFNKNPQPTQEQIQMREERMQKMQQVREQMQGSTNNTTNPQ